MSVVPMFERVVGCGESFDTTCQFSDALAAIDDAMHDPRDHVQNEEQLVG